MKNSKLKKILNDFPIHRNNNKWIYIEYLKKYHCETEFEKIIIEKVLGLAPNQATISRETAHLQNVLWLYKPWDETIDLTPKKEEKKSFFSCLKKCLFNKN